MSGPLSPEQLQQLADARRRMHRLMRPARVATFTLWSVGVFGALTLLWGLVAGGLGPLVGAALVAVAWNEKRGRDRLRRLEPQGARILGRNQLILGAVVVAYCVVAILQARAGAEPSVRELETAAGIPHDVIAQITTLAYGAVALIVAISQALLARYHAARAQEVLAFRRDTPRWVVEILAGE